MNFKFKLSQRLARIKWTAVIAGALALGCELAKAGPQISRIDHITITPTRFSLVPFQTADLSVQVGLSRADTSALASMKWSTTGGVIMNFGMVGNVWHIGYQAPSQPGNYLLIVTTVYGPPADTAHMSVTVAEVPVYAVTVSPNSASLAVGDTVTLHTALTDSTGATVVGRATDWTSSDQGVATVLATGFVRAVATGSTTITATVEGKTGTAVITVH